jgi:hypothetical protein
MADHKLLQVFHILLGKWMKGRIPVLIKEGGSAVVGAILGAAYFLEIAIDEWANGSIDGWIPVKH